MCELIHGKIGKKSADNYCNKVNIATENTRNTSWKSQVEICADFEKNTVYVLYMSKHHFTKIVELYETTISQSTCGQYDDKAYLLIWVRRKDGWSQITSLLWYIYRVKIGSNHER